MNLKTIDKIVWYIPFKQLRKNVRELLASLCGYYLNIRQPDKGYDIDFIMEFRKSIEEDKNFIVKYNNLLKNLDNKSVDIISDIIMSKIYQYKNIEDDVYFTDEEIKKHNKILYDFYSNIFKINDNCYVYKKYILPIKEFSIETFYDLGGINCIKKLDHIRNKNIIDAGGYIGDTAIVFSDYTDKNVYSFEPFEKNFNIMLKTIELNNKNNIIPVKIALGDENKEMYMYCDNKSDFSGSMKLENKAENISDNTTEKKIRVMTLDKFVEDNNLEVGLIKTDLEGFEQNFLKGAVNTIKKQKPVLMISIYHSYDDFFNIKPMIESWNLRYNFSIFKASKESAISETKLIAEVS